MFLEFYEAVTETGDAARPRPGAEYSTSTPTNTTKYFCRVQWPDAVLGNAEHCRARLTCSARCRWEALLGGRRRRRPGWGWCTPSAQTTTAAAVAACEESLHQATHACGAAAAADLLVDGEQLGRAHLLWRGLTQCVVAERLQGAADVEPLVDDLG